MSERDPKTRTALRTGLRLAGWWLLYFVFLTLTVVPANGTALALAALFALGIAYLTVKRNWDFWWA